MVARALSLNSIQRTRWAIRVLCILGIGVSGYLTWTHLAGADPYCGGSGSCTTVQNSSYSEVLGIPVSLIGLLGYLILLALSLLNGNLSAEIGYLFPVWSFGVALVGVLYSGYLTYLEAFVIHAWCYWCVSSAIIITAIWFLSIVELRDAWAGE